MKFPGSYLFLFLITWSLATPVSRAEEKRAVGVSVFIEYIELDSADYFHQIRSHKHGSGHDLRAKIQKLVKSGKANISESLYVNLKNMDQASEFGTYTELIYPVEFETPYGDPPPESAFEEPEKLNEDEWAALMQRSVFGCPVEFKTRKLGVIVQLQSTVGPKGEPIISMRPELSRLDRWHPQSVINGRESGAKMPFSTYFRLVSTGGLYAVNH